MRFSIKPLKRAKVKLQKAGGLPRDLMGLIGALPGAEDQVGLEVRVDLEDLGVLEALVTGGLLVADLGLLAVLVCHLGEDLVGQMPDHLEVRLVGRQEDHLEGRWEDLLEDQLGDLDQEECHHGVHLEALEDHLEQEALEDPPADHLGGHRVACPLHGWLDLEDHLGDPLECLLGEWLPRQELATLPSLASGLNTQLQMERGIITMGRRRILCGKSRKSLRTGRLTR